MTLYLRLLLLVFCLASISPVQTKNGGAKRDRTADLLRARQALSQLSYSPKLGFSVFGVAS